MRGGDIVVKQQHHHKDDPRRNHDCYGLYYKERISLTLMSTLTQPIRAIARMRWTRCPNRCIETHKCLD